LLLLAKAIPTGSSNCVTPFASIDWIVSTTWWSVPLPGAVSTTLTESETWFATQTSAPSGRTATATGSIPTATSAIRVRVPASITLSVLFAVLAT
jgi:hypothetical protein